VTDYVRVAGRDGLVRDTQTKAIVNTDRAGYEAYIKQRDTALQRQATLERHETDINSIKSDLAEIKQLLLAVLSK
jgi:hypothetical protein